MDGCRHGGLPVLWTFLALFVGSFGMAPVWVAAHVVVFGVAVCIGLGQRWAYAVSLLGAVVLVDSLANPGVLVALGWVFGTLYLAIGVALLVASRRPRP